MNKKLFWCSWYQPTEDYRPVQFPPSENILAWWKSGESQNGKIKVICAWVQAFDLDDLVKQVHNNWPEIEDLSLFRFYEEHQKYMPSDRFPTEGYDWMLERLNTWK